MTQFVRRLTGFASAISLAAVLGLGVALLPGSAEAAPVLVRFDGVQIMGQHWGIGADSVNAAGAAAVPLYTLDPAGIGEALTATGGPFAISQNLMSNSDPMSAPVSALSEWTATNISMAALAAPSFLIFARVEETVPADPYTGAEVLIEIDPALGWVLAETLVMGTRIVYPALLIDGLDPAQALAFDIRYLVERSLPIGVGPVGDDVGQYLPQFRLAAAGPGAVIPEPTTALLLGAGLLALLARRRMVICT